MLAWRFGWCDQQASLRTRMSAVLVRRRVGRCAERVGDQASDRQVGLLVEITAPGKAPQGCPLPQLGVGVLDTDPGRGLLRRTSCQARLSPSHASFLGFLGGAVTWRGNSLASPAYPASTWDFTEGWSRSCSAMPSVRRAVRSGIRPGRTTPDSSMRPCPSLNVVVLIVFCRRLPETKARRPGRPARGRLTCVSAPSSRSSTFLGLGVGEDILQCP